MTAFKNIISTDRPVRFVGRWAAITLIYWAITTSYIVLVVVLGLPYGYRLLTQTCQPCFIYGQLSEANRQDLLNIGISIETYATIYVVLFVIFTLICLGVAALVAWKKPGELMPFLAAQFIMVLVTIEGIFVFYTGVLKDYPFLDVRSLVFAPISLGIGYLFLAFPTGKFKQPVFLWLFIGGSLSGNFYNLLFNPSPLAPVDVVQSLLVRLPFAAFVLVIGFFLVKNPQERKVTKYLFYFVVCFAYILAVCYLGAVAEFGTYLIALIYQSSRGIFSPRERSAAKWLIYGFTIWIISIFGILWAVPTYFSWMLAPGYYIFLFINVVGFFGCGINLTGLLMSILYANVFDINLVIKRTLIYTTLTILVVGIYLGSVIGLQALVRSVSGQQSDLAVVGATLVAATLFQPLRKAIQQFVDHRFYRRKYNAARTISEFSTNLQHETDLKLLSVQLKEVLNDTLEPEQVSVWLKRRPQTKSSANQQ